jgi:hypothetical protein
MSVIIQVGREIGFVATDDGYQVLDTGNIRVCKAHGAEDGER